MSLETEIAVVKNEVANMNTLFVKLDTAIDKLSDVANDISKMLAVHERRIELGEKTDNELFDLVEKRRQEMQSDVKEVHSRISTIQREISGEIQDTKKEITHAINSLKAEIKEEYDSYKKDHEDQEERIKELEKWRWMILGGAAVVGLITSKLGFILEKLF